MWNDKYQNDLETAFLKWYQINPDCTMYKFQHDGPDGIHFSIQHMKNPWNSKSSSVSFWKSKEFCIESWHGSTQNAWNFQPQSMHFTQISQSKSV